MTPTLIMAGKAVYLDTSGILGMLDAGDEFHAPAAAAWNDLLDAGLEMVMTDYVRLESWSLIQRRLGLEAAEDFHQAILPLCSVRPVGETGFGFLARQAVLMKRRNLSIVDLSSFDCMRREGLRLAFAFDAHFDEQGFLTPQSPGWVVPPEK